MKRNIEWWLVVCALAAPLCALAQDQPAEEGASDKKAAAEAEKEAKKKHDEGVKKCLDEFKKAFMEAKSPNERASAIRLLGVCDEKDPKIVARIASFLATDPSDKESLAPMAAAQALGGFHKDRTAAAALLGAVEANKKNSRLQEYIILALGQVGGDSALPVLVSHLKDNDAEVASAAARALGDLNTAAAIEPLLKTLERLERDEKLGSEVNPGGVGGGNIGLAEANGDARKRAGTVKPAIKESLRKITGEEYMTSKDYQEWWAKNRATFKVKGADDGKEKTAAKDKKAAK